MRKDFTRFVVICFVVTIFLIACGLSEILQMGLEDAGAQLDKTVWVLRAFGEQGNPKAVVDGRAVTLEFDFDEETLRGNGGCNSYTASFKSVRKELSISPATSTLMGCFPEEIMNQETAFHQVLAKVNRYEVKEGILFLYTSDNQVLEFSSQ